jgi:hypothetical protein
MVLEVIAQKFAICEITDVSEIDFSDEFCFIGKTDEELSLVCSADRIPKNAVRIDAGWKAFRIQGELEFSLTGILSGIAAVLADAGIGIFAVSTYRTDYILTKEKTFENALSALSAAGYAVLR